MGECPSWYSFIRASKYLGVAPWELLEQPAIWVQWANQAEGAEADAERNHLNRAQRRSQM